MPSLPEDKLAQLEKRFDSVEAALAAGPAADAFVRLSKEYAELEPVVRPISAWRRAVEELRSAEELAGSPDKDMAEMAAAEIGELRPKIAEMEQNIRILLLPKDAADEKNVILEVRAGTGGDEAALFAGDLLRMYQRYADLQGWKFSIMEASDGDAGGYKEVIANISGKGAYARLKYESGVHRVQRVPRPRRRAASTPPPRRLPCCPRSKRSTSTSSPKTSASIRCARPAPAASTSTPRTRRCASRISRPASWWSPA